MNFYEETLQYLMSDMLINAYDFAIIKGAIKIIMGKHPRVPYELVLILIAKPPTIESPLVQKFIEEGKVKSFQKKEVCVKIKDIIKGALNNYLESSLNRFSKIKNFFNQKGAHIFVPLIEPFYNFLFEHS